MKIKIKITDNYKELNPEKSFIYKIRNFMSFPEKKLIFLNSIKKNFSLKSIKNLFNYKKSNKGMEQISLNEAIKIISNNKIEKYKEIQKIRNNAYKEIKLNFPTILKDISESTNSYNWNVHLEFNVSSSRSIEYVYYTKILLKSLDNSLLEGDLLIKNDDYLSFSEKVRVPLRNGSINILDVEKPIDFQDKNNNYVLAIEHHDRYEDPLLKSSLLVNYNHKVTVKNKEFSINTGIQKIDYINSKISKFFNIDEGFKNNFWFISPIILISKDISWKFLTMTINHISGLQNYFSNQDNSYLNIENKDFIKEIYYSIKSIDLKSIENIDHVNKVKNHLKEMDFNNDISDEELIEMFEVLKLIDY